MAAVIFDSENFRKLYPAFSDEVAYPDELLEEYFSAAESFVGNDGNSFAPYDPSRKVFLRKRLLDLVMCHLLTLDKMPNGPVGRVSSATQGSVSTSFDLLKTNSFIGDWWAQTKCGAMYWVLTARYRIGGRFYGGSNYHPWG
ncbi:DUF4054 domain-containing protein [uncultured Parasutterella sp.]|uniref:DUF4054 domain-containing protein n=1 Tax=uncultured Parasutterella sp. TaxID=1263098 RepID=UPI00259807F0|nr:DUF4054 domain-containing protein [uncultured Parasutterella sp.]